MDQQGVLFPRGLFRNEKTFLGDYRQRAYFIGKYQSYASTVYLLVVLVLKEVIEVLCSTTTYTYLIKSKTQILDRLEVDVQFSDVPADLYFWLCLSVISATLHIFSSVFIMWATYETTPKLRALRLCNWARRINLVFLLCELIVFVVIHQRWDFAFFFVFYRLLFHHEVSGLWNTLYNLSAPPPGHHF